jgi:hypothetical protein
MGRVWRTGRCGSRGVGLARPMDSRKRPWHSLGEPWRSGNPGGRGAPWAAMGRFGAPLENHSPLSLDALKWFCVETHGFRNGIAWESIAVHGPGPRQTMGALLGAPDPASRGALRRSACGSAPKRMCDRAWKRPKEKGRPVRSALVGSDGLRVAEPGASPNAGDLTQERAAELGDRVSSTLYVFEYTAFSAVCKWPVVSEAKQTTWTGAAPLTQSTFSPSIYAFSHTLRSRASPTHPRLSTSGASPCPV